MKKSFLLLLSLLPVFFTKAEILTTYRDIPYVSVTSDSFSSEYHILDVYTPRVKNTSTEVVVFIHGGKWKMGSKDMFNYVGLNFAAKGKTAVLINYRLSPEVQYDEMTMDCAKALKWVYSQIEYYGGDKTKIYLYGHSSGGHLAALLATNNRFFDSLGMQNPIKGCVLIDAFGMNMYNYLKVARNDDQWMFETFTKDENNWKDASPALYVTDKSPKFLLFLGEKTRNVIYHDVKNFSELLDKKGIPTELVVMNNRSHMEMVGQMIDYRNPIFDKCIAFMKSD